MYRLLRRLKQDERGQALVIACVGMLVMAVVVMASVSIGHGVYEKIKLQDAADAQAYSLAVKEARAYNFLAYTNRAMVVHYAAMMTVVSYVSHAFYLDTVIGTAAKFLKMVPVIGAVFAVVEQVIKAWKKAVEAASKALLPILRYLNIGLWMAQEAMVFATLLDLFSSNSHDPVRGTDPKATVGTMMGSGFFADLATTLADGKTNCSNARSFLATIDDGPRVKARNPCKDIDINDPTGMRKRAKLLKANDLTDPDMAKYRLLMANLANGVRKKWTAVGKGPLLIGRDWDLKIFVGIGLLMFDKTAVTEMRNYRETYKNNLQDQIFARERLSIRLRYPCWKGLCTKTVYNFDLEVTADRQKGGHRMFGKLKDKHHPWDGITPFYRTDPSFINPWKHHFGYPCSLVVLSKNMTGQKQVFQLEFDFEKGHGTVENNGVLDLSWKKVGGNTFRQLTGGMLAFATARAIYHRPGDWKEQPNFFNPLWVARLSPTISHWDEGALNQYKTVVPEWGAVNKLMQENTLNY